METHIDSKFYVPEISEFHVGFEYEFKHSDYPENGWVKYDSPEFNPEKEDYCLCLDRSQFRVKYLDREGIEDCGFALTEKGDAFSVEALVFKLTKEEGFNTGIDYTIVHYPNNPTLVYLSYQQFSSYDNSKGEFRFTIKNRTELKRILKQLNII